MATAILRKSNNGGRSKEDLHVKMSDAPKVPETGPGEGGRYVYVYSRVAYIGGGSGSAAPSARGSDAP